ncbi:hypothetical protein E2C01_028031 [Portunus trituberculatus]|uniref:Uncharacterized protein n=1 Tax=Portunus trituberculatus TaxID=210409 RepID=A0A5B7EMJ2_PORTR|nr:hypothetical protein [Portunus trituberculatus]
MLPSRALARRVYLRPSRFVVPS